MSTEDPQAPWLRVHPASPFVQGWIAILGLIFIYLQNTRELSFAERFAQERLPMTALIGGGLLLVILLAYFLSWYFTRYRITATHVYVNTGMIFRSQKQARIDKVQSIEIAQPLVARLLGLAELRFDVADGSSSVLRLSYLKKDEAAQLRRQILTLAHGQQPTAAASVESVDTPVPDIEDERVLVRVPPGRLIGSFLLRPGAIIGALLTITLLVLTIVGVGGFAAGLLPALLGFGGWFYKELNGGWNFTASVTDTGLRVAYGLTDTKQQSVPVRRVQAIEISRPWLWGSLGWYRMQINVLGTGSGDDGSESTTVVLPVGDVHAVAQIMGILLPNLGVAEQREVLLTALEGSGEQRGFTVSPRAARIFSPWAWRVQGFVVTPTTLITRHGRLGRRATFTPHTKVQGTSWRQGPLDRRRALATVRVHSAGGTVLGELEQIDSAVAAEFFEAQAQRASER